LGLSASLGDCQAVVDLVLELDRSPDAALVPGVLAAGTLGRDFHGHGTGICPNSCPGGFLVEVEKL
jgi:hypothetical protein